MDDLKRTEGLCCWCGKVVKLYRQDKEGGRTFQYDNKILMEHINCDKLGDKRGADENAINS